MKKWKLIVSLISSVIVLVVFGIFTHHLISFPIEESALEKHITEQVNRNANTKPKIIIEEIKDIGNFKTMLFSVHDGDLPTLNLKLGFAFYEKSGSGKYRLDGMGWGTNAFDSYLFEASVGNKKETFLVVYGKNPSESKVFERFEVKFQDEIFVGNLAKEEYFVEAFPVTETNNTDKKAMTNINFETKDHYIESFPLLITSNIKF